MSRAVNPSRPCHALKQSSAKTSLEARIKTAERAGDNLGMRTPSNKALNPYHDLLFYSSNSVRFGTTVTRLVIQFISAMLNHVDDVVIGVGDGNGAF